VRRSSPVTELLFLATLFTITFAKLRWNVGGDLNIADVLTGLFLLSFAADRLGRGDGRLSRSAVVVSGFFAAFLVVYLVGFFNLETEQALDQFWKGMVKFVLHFLFLAVGVAYLVRRSEHFYWRALGALVAGMAVNGVYGLAQLSLARAGVNLDELVLSPITGGASAINIYGVAADQTIYRTNALSGDPNHLAIMLLVPLLVLPPLYLRLEAGHRLRTPIAALLAFLLIVFLTTLSRSGMLGLAVGLAVLALPYRRLLLSRAVLLPLGVVAAIVGFSVVRRLEYFAVVLRERLRTDDASTGAHFDVYGFVPEVLATHPLFGLGLNNFSVYYEAATGRADWGPHSFYVALLVETGLVGTALFAVFLWWLFARLGALRAVGRALAAQGDGLAARVRPLAWGLTAALAGTLAANLFYLTMIFYYFFAFAMLAAAAAAVFGRRLAYVDEVAAPTRRPVAVPGPARPPAV
jgi:hypothetical protein